VRVIRAALAALVAATLLPAGALAQLPGQPGSCPVEPDASKLPSAAKLRKWNRVIDHGVRPTGSHAQLRYIRWIERKLRGVEGVELSRIDHTISRFTPRSTAIELRAGGRKQRIKVAAPVPYAKPTGRRGARAPLAFVPDDQPITAENARGRIVLRHAPAGAIQQALFFLPVVSWGFYDPENTIDPAENFYGDFINYNARVADLRAAGEAGAKGVIFYKDLPHRQLKDHYEPYEGERWPVPAAFVGADQGKRLADAIAAGAGARARVTLRARYKRVRTRTVIATIEGQSPERIVVDSHTDGTNAAEDNGPVAMVGMARYFAGLPAECRPRTIEFAFVTGHFYQRIADPAKRHGGAGVVAEQLDAAYDEGTVSSVLVLEHMGALSYSAEPRAGDRPGGVLRPNGLREIQFVAITNSQPLVRAVDDVVRKYDMQRTLMLQGADAPGSTVPSHCSFGGEGTPYNQHLLPTVAAIAAPQTLYNPVFGLEGIDFEVMRDEMLGYTELMHRLGTMSQQEVAGAVLLDRERRELGGEPCPPEN
jgi:hypothetical protein